MRTPAGVLDALVFFVYVAVAALGVFRSPFFLVGAWLAFIPWNFAPHKVPPMYAALPVACALFCIPVALYLVWGAREKRWTPLRPASGS